MIKNNFIKKGLAIVVIFLFIVLTITPIIHAEIRKKSELVEISTEILGYNKGKYSVQLTMEEAEEIRKLIGIIEKRLDDVETFEETLEIFNEAINELDKHGLLGSINVDQIQKLVTGMVFKPILMDLMRFYNFFKNGKILESDIINYVCLFSAYTIDAFEINILGLLQYFINVLYYRMPLKILYLLNYFIYEYSQKKPVRLLNQIDIGIGVAKSYFTFGLLGKRNGSYDFHTADGFCGIKIISKQEQRESYYLGFALRVTKKTIL